MTPNLFGHRLQLGEVVVLRQAKELMAPENGQGCMKKGVIGKRVVSNQTSTRGSNRNTTL